MTSTAALPTAASGAAAIDVAWRCVHEGGALARSRFGGAHAIEVKGHRNIVTDTDVATELLIKSLLQAEFPSHKILSEETASTTDASSGWTWVIDPIDGTKNYACGIPFWCTNIALCHDGAPMLGITWDPLRQEGFCAVRGGGAFCGDERMTASRRADVYSSVIAIDLGYDDARGAVQLELVSRIFPQTQGIRLLGSAALGMAYAACGRVDLYTHLNVAPWDVAPGLLLVEEAGGKTSDRDGGPMTIMSSGFVAGGALVHDDFVARYASVRGEQL